jgi:hypothetical protein
MANETKFHILIKMERQNKALFDQFYKKIVKTFKKEGGILVVYDFGERVYDFEKFENEKQKILKGEFSSEGTVMEDLYHMYGVTTKIGASYLILIYDPYEVWSNEIILETIMVDTSLFENLEYTLLYDFR